MPRLGRGGAARVGEMVPLGLDPHRLVERRCEVLVGLVGARFEQRVLRKLLGEEGVELEVLQLQQLDGLPKLGRQDQLLALADA